jgi:hypothetical protein
MNSGGGACYTAGFREGGEEGSKIEKELLDNVGDFALIGPNCYGMINYVNKIALWPFGRSFTDEKHLIPLIKSLFGFTGQISPLNPIFLH